MTLKTKLIAKINEARLRLKKDKLAAQTALLRYLAVLKWIEAGRPESLVIRRFAGWMTLYVGREYDEEEGFYYLIVTGFPDVKEIVIDVQAVTFEAGEGI